MVLKINIPDEQGETLRRAWGNELDRAAVEALALEGYRAGKFGAATVAQLLGHASRWDTERWLLERLVPLNYSAEDLESDRKTLRGLLGEIE
jgi:predicted HTH domain antitoxin